MARGMYFLSIAESALGTITSISTEKGRCSTKTGNTTYKCYKFYGHLEFLSTEGQAGSLQVPAGYKSRNCPKKIVTIEDANLYLGEKIPLKYNPADLSEAYPGNGRGVFAIPFVLMLFAGALLAIAQAIRYNIRKHGEYFD